MPPPAARPAQVAAPAPTPAPEGCNPRPVYFALDSSLLDDSARGQLASDAQCLVRTKQGALMVNGMADARGTEEYNLALSDRRARSVMSYLGSFGIDGNRVTIRGLGEEMAKGKDEVGWQEDRRAEIRLP